MLNFAEEILLLALDEGKGAFKSFPELAMRTALAGALLMELALADRIDTDPDVLKVISTDPTGDPIVDNVLEILGQESYERSTTHWLNEIVWRKKNLWEQVLQQLVSKGVLKVEDRKILWVFTDRRYPLVDSQEVKEVRERLRELVFSVDIPDPRDAVLIGLVNACGLVDGLFSQEELESVTPRLTELARLELIGREVDRSIREIFKAMGFYRIA